MRHLFMGRCVFRTREDVCCPIISQEEMRTRGLVHIRAGGSMRSWKSPDRGEYLPVYENERGTYIFNSKDLCMIEHIPDLLDAGIDSYKIEGRMKTALYVATVARTYRKAIDDYLESPRSMRRIWSGIGIRSRTVRTGSLLRDFSMGSRIMRARFMIVIRM